MTRITICNQITKIFIFLLLNVRKTSKSPNLHNSKVKISKLIVAINHHEKYASL